MLPGRQKALRSVREGDVTEVVAESAEADDLAPVLMLRVARIGRDEDILQTTARSAVLGASEDIEDASGELHDAEAMLEAFVRRSRIDEPCEGELVNEAKSLKRPRRSGARRRLRR